MEREKDDSDTISSFRVCWLLVMVTPKGTVNPLGEEIVARNVLSMISDDLTREA